MRTVKSRIFQILFVGIFGGLVLAFMFINPYNGNILLSETVLQLSGSMGEFPLMPVFKDLISFTMRMLLDYIFEIYMGIELYRHFCTASVCVFSRTSHRTQWYIKEILEIMVAAFLYQIVKIFSAVIVTYFRYSIQIDRMGIFLLVFHVLVYTMWVFSITLLINIFCIKYGSNNAFIWIGGTQLILTALLELIQIFETNLNFIKIFLNINPMAHLVVGWHTGEADKYKHLLASPYEGLYFKNTIIMLFGFSVLVVITGMHIVCRHDFLQLDVDGEGE